MVPIPACFSYTYSCIAVDSCQMTFYFQLHSMFKAVVKQMDSSGVFASRKMLMVAEPCDPDPLFW